MELGRNPPEVTLDHIVKDLLSFFNGFECLHEAKRQIERKCDIKKEPEHKCWSEDYIKQAWEETIKEDKKSSRRRHWARVIMLQIVKSFVCDTCKQNTAQKNRHAATHEQDCETTPNSEDRIIQSKAVLESVRAAAGDEQMFEGKKVSEVSKLSDDSGVVSGSQLSASSTDEALSPPEVNPVADSINSKTKSAALNEDEDDSNDQQNDVDDYELYVENMHDPENDIWEESLCSTDDINQACGKAESMKGNSQSSDGLKTVEAAGEAKQSIKHTVSNSDGQTNIGSQGGPVTQCPAGGKDTTNDIGSGNSRSGADISATSSDYENMDIVVDEINYIYIPFSEFGSELTSHQSQTQPDENPNADGNLNYTYNLMDGVPSNTQDKIYRKKSYVMQYDSNTKNAKWVYEILNKSTVPFNYKKPVFKEDNKIGNDDQALESKTGFENKDYVRGHLAAAANHMWCQEAYDDTFLISNMTPQISIINNGIWKTLEGYCRSKIREDKVCNVHVYTGPLYPNSNKILKGKAVPSHYFKVVIIENVDGKAKVECYMVENKKKESENTDNTSTANQKKKKREKINRCDHISDLKTIEEKSGLTFIRKSEKNEGVIVKKTLEITGENGSKRATIEVKIVDA